MNKDDLLKKWLNDELTAAEKEAFSKQEDYAINKAIIENAQHFKASEFSKVDDFKIFESKYNANTSVKRLNWLKPMLRIASVLVIGFAIYFTLFSNESLVEKRTFLAEKTTIDLPDLSQVTLNADSEITFDKDTWFDKRQLNLKGEAYFKVAKGKTFDVITTNGTVTVVGTEFNVKSRQNYFEVVCYEGIVKVTTNNMSKQLLAGDTFRILKTAFSQDKTNVTAPNWLNNKSRFKAIPFAEVVKELERQYNVKVRFKNVETSRAFSGGFVHNNLENALLTITKPMNLTYTISSSNQVLIQGNGN